MPPGRLFAVLEDLWANLLGTSLDGINKALFLSGVIGGELQLLDFVLGKCLYSLKSAVGQHCTFKKFGCAVLRKGILDKRLGSARFEFLDDLIKGLFGNFCSKCFWRRRSPFA